MSSKKIWWQNYCLVSNFESQIPIWKCLFESNFLVRYRELSDCHLWHANKGKRGIFYTNKDLRLTVPLGVTEMDPSLAPTSYC